MYSAELLQDIIKELERILKDNGTDPLEYIKSKK
jgi:hypothetical protein